ncbi:PilN domain-containing protein [Duffyella gerundensis]|uniref:PilN domain-containing protein n=1 Tax=Duffyella gerundensis TaxID=1619313 RepID=UPI003FD5C59C
MVWVNLLPWRARQQQHILRQSIVIALSAGAIVTLIAMLLFISARDRQQQLQTNSDALIAASKEAEQRLHQLQQALALQQQLNNAWAHYQAQQQLAQQWLDFFMHLGSLMPKALWLTQLQRNADTLTFAGRGYAMQEIADFRQRLAEQPLLLQVKLGSVTRQPGGELSFRIDARVKQGGERWMTH